MASDERNDADRRLAEALEVHGFRDPREFYRNALRELREIAPASYDEAVGYYKETLLPAVSSGNADPVVAWTEYGVRLAQLRAEGRTVSVDGTGRSQSYESPPGPGQMVLHLPEDKKLAALLVALPRELTSAQRATYDWLVAGQQKLQEARR